VGGKLAGVMVSVQSSKLIYQRAGLLLRGTQTGWVDELTGTSQSST